MQEMLEQEQPTLAVAVVAEVKNLVLAALVVQV